MFLATRLRNLSARPIPILQPQHCKMSEGEKKKTILFFHPDLGIGGAERLIIDAAVGLQNRGHKVVIFTSHCDPKHCFEEARDGMTRSKSSSVVTASNRRQAPSKCGFAATR